MDAGDFINTLPFVATVVDALWSARRLQYTIGVNGPCRPPLLRIAPVIPIGGVLPMILPAAFTIRDAVALAIKIINFPTLRPPASIRFQRANGQQNMSVRIARSLVMDGKISAHPGIHKIVFDE